MVVARARPDLTAASAGWRRTAAYAAGLAESLSSISAGMASGVRLVRAVARCQADTPDVGFARERHVVEEVRELGQQQRLGSVDQSFGRIRVEIDQHHVGA